MKASRVLALTAALCAFAGSAAAFTLEPMSTLLAPDGAGSVATFRIKNDGSERVAIRLEILSRGLSPDGKETNAPAKELFVVYPSRLLIEPGATAVAKLQWKGPRRMDAEMPFRLLAEQESVDPSPEMSSGIKMRFRYLASVYVGSGGFAPKLEAKVEGAAGPKGEKGFLVELKNSGTRHVVDRDASITLDGTDGLVLSAEDLGELGGANFLPDSSRKLFIPSERAEIGKSYDARLDYKAEY